jgi:hypothetical protein
MCGRCYSTLVINKWGDTQKMFNERPHNAVFFNTNNISPLLLTHLGTQSFSSRPDQLFTWRGKFGKNSSACRQHEIQYREQRLNKYTYNYTYNFTCVFSHTSHRVKNILIVKMAFINEMQLRT